MEGPVEALGGVPVVEYGTRRIVITVAVMLSALLETLDSTIVNVALPTIEGNIGASLDQGVWIITGYVISNVVSIPLNPLLIRLFGRRRYFTTCIVGFTLASVLCSTSTSLAMLVAFRIMQGAFGGGLIATSQGIMRDTFPPQAVGMSSGLFAIALIVGPAIGPIAGGYLTDNFSWQWIFLVNLVPGVLAAIVIGTMLRDPVGPEHVRIDWTGVAMLAVGLATMQTVLDNGQRLDWFSDPGIATAAGISVLCLAAFCRRSFTAANPVVDLKVVRFRSVGVGMILALVFGMIVFAPAVITPQYSSGILNYTAWDSGLLLAGRALPVILLTPLFATLAQNGADVRYMLGTGFVVNALSLLWLAGMMTSSSPFTALSWPLFCSGIGQSMLLVPLIVGVLTTTPAALNGKIAPLITLSVQLGGSVSTALSVAFYGRRAAFHSVILSGKATLSHLASLGMRPTHDAIAQLSNLINQEATTMGFADTIFLAGLLAAAAAPLVLLFPRSKRMTG